MKNYKKPEILVIHTDTIILLCSSEVTNGNGHGHGHGHHHGHHHDKDEEDEDNDYQKDMKLFEF